MAIPLQRLLLAIVLGGLVLLLAVPLVFTASTVYPYVVGKALYSRLVIEIVVAAWATLAAFAPAYRPRRSTVFLLLGAGLAAAAVSAVLGVSPQRSFWSNYERMQGVVDSAHWAALALAGACVLRTREHWLALVHCNLAVGMTVAGLAVLQYFGVHDVAFYGDRLPDAKGRPTGTLGNPIYLGAYAAVNAILACGLLVDTCRSRREGPPARQPRTRKRLRSGSERAPGGAPGRPIRLRRALTMAWLVASAIVHVWAALLAGSRGPLLGAVFGTLLAAFACACLARGRSRIAALSALTALAALGSAPFLIGALAPPGFLKAVDLPPSARRMISINIGHPTVQSRLTAWRAGVNGFVDRPVFGWGPENYLVPFARHGADWPSKSMKAHDYAHSAFFEKLATEGAAGAVLYLALWVAIGIAMARTIREAQGRERVFALTAAAALAAYFASQQTLFPTTVGSMHYALLLVFTGSREMRLRGRNAAEPSPGRRPRGSQTLAVGAVWCLAGAGAWAHTAMWDAAVGAARAVTLTAPLQTVRPYRLYDRAIRAFEPMASDIRLHAFARFAPRLASGRTRLETVLGWLDAQAAAAVAAEPQNWRLRHSVAQVYASAAQQDPSLFATAQVHADALIVMAPKPRGVLSLLGTPDPVPRVRLRATPDGVLLDWPPVPGALTYRLSLEHPGDRPVRVVEGVPTQAIVDPGTGGRHIRLQACLGRANCSPWSDPVPLDSIAAPAKPPTPATDATERPRERQHR